MKKYFLFALFLIAFQSFSQSSSENEILALSDQIFKWEVANKIDSLEAVFDEKFVVVSGDGSSQNKSQYLTVLRSGNFLHNSIDVIEHTAAIADNTATVIGKGKFTVTISGNKVTLLLSYIEVFTRLDSKKQWKVLAMHATVLEY